MVLGRGNGGREKKGVPSRPSTEGGGSKAFPAEGECRDPFRSLKGGGEEAVHPEREEKEGYFSALGKRREHKKGTTFLPKKNIACTTSFILSRRKKRKGKRRGDGMKGRRAPVNHPPQRGEKEKNLQEEGIPVFSLSQRMEKDEKKKQKEALFY